MSELTYDLASDALEIPLKLKTKKINSKIKGSSNEKRACKTLFKWTGIEFHRTPASGGLKWYMDNRIVGDIVAPPNANFPFVVEVKAHKSIDLDIPTIKKVKMFTFFNQVLRDAYSVGKEPLLMARQNQMKNDEWVIGVKPEFGKFISTTFSINPISVGSRIIDNSTIQLQVFRSYDFFSISYNELLQRWLTM